MGLFSKKPKSSVRQVPAAQAALPPPDGRATKPAVALTPVRPPKGKMRSVASADFLALRSEMMDLRARLDASEQAKALIETRLAALDATTTAMSTQPTAAPDGTDHGLVARIDALAAHLELVSSVGAPDPTIATRLEALTAKVEAAALTASAGQDDDTIARIDALAERINSFDSFGSELAQLNARVSAQAELGAELGSLRDRISELSNQTDDRRAAALAATGDTDLRDRVNSIADRISGNEGIAAQIAQLAQRVAANDTTTRQATEQVAAIEQRLNSVSTELANQVSELGRDIDGLAAHTNDVASSNISDDVIDSLKTSQVKLAAEQARYEIAFRQDLATLAEQVRRKS